ncbi:MAG: hypothetical protein QE267_05680 [Akkermansiaceae bacterium]|jgi:hypothetical protein|nr:hypothetical protein [Akkermansiaceae bacterium]
MKSFLITLFASMLAVSSSFADEGAGRAGLKNPLGVEIETEFYAGKRGYLHGGLGVIAPINEKQEIGIVGHFVREETDGEIFPSLGAEFIQDFGGGYGLEAFSFGYLPVEQQSAWAVGLRGSRRFASGDDVSITPFFGPAYAHVRALDEATQSPVSIGHLMLLGGIDVEAGPVELTVFASHSFFSRDPVGLETHVDLEEMTHFAAYENNDGFAENTVGGELSYSLTDWLTLTGRYALILYKDETRHSISFTPAVKLGAHLEVFAGVQLLRGDGIENDLVMTGVAFSF